MKLIDILFKRNNISNPLLTELVNYDGNTFRKIFSKRILESLESKEISKDDLTFTMNKYLKNRAKKCYSKIKIKKGYYNLDNVENLPLQWSTYIEYGIAIKIIKDKNLQEKYFQSIAKSEDIVKKEISFLLL